MDDVQTVAYVVGLGGAVAVGLSAQFGLVSWHVANDVTFVVVVCLVAITLIRRRARRGP
jgi:hypothetical protein